MIKYKCHHHWSGKNLPDHLCFIYLVPPLSWKWALLYLGTHWKLFYCLFTPSGSHDLGFAGYKQLLRKFVFISADGGRGVRLNWNVGNLRKWRPEKLDNDQAVTINKRLALLLLIVVIILERIISREAACCMRIVNGSCRRRHSLSHWTQPPQPDTTITANRINHNQFLDCPSFGTPQNFWHLFLFELVWFAAPPEWFCLACCFHSLHFSSLFFRAKPPIRHHQTLCRLGFQSWRQQNTLISIPSSWSYDPPTSLPYSLEAE